MKNRRTIRLAGAPCFLGLLLLLATSAGAQEFTVDVITFSAGTQSSGGDFSLWSSIGQPDAGVGIAGGDALFLPGFWSALGPTAPTLSIFRDGTDIVIIWPESPGSGFVLEQADTLGSPSANTSWSDVAASTELAGGFYRVRLPIGSGNQFYRLHKP